MTIRPTTAERQPDADRETTRKAQRRLKSFRDRLEQNLARRTAVYAFTKGKDDAIGPWGHA